jgi:rRNA maturation endonuclease Nob1
MHYRDPNAENGLLARAFDWIRERARRTEELASLTQADLDFMASDLGITQADLLDVLPRAADDSYLMDRMMEARGLDPEKVRRNLGALVRDMELVCTRCRDTGVCRRDLRNGTAEEHCHEYCANAETIDEILETSAKA